VCHLTRPDKSFHAVAPEIHRAYGVLLGDVDMVAAAVRRQVWARFLEFGVPGAVPARLEALGPLALLVRGGLPMDVRAVAPDGLK
jgi:hypothetical protein